MLLNNYSRSYVLMFLLRKHERFSMIINASASAATHHGLIKRMGVVLAGRRCKLGSLRMPLNHECLNSTHVAMIYRIGPQCEIRCPSRLPCAKRPNRLIAWTVAPTCANESRIATPHNLRNMPKVNRPALCIINLVVVANVAEQHLAY